MSDVPGGSGCSIDDALWHEQVAASLTRVSNWHMDQAKELRMDNAIENLGDDLLSPRLKPPTDSFATKRCTYGEPQQEPEPDEDAEFEDADPPMSPAPKLRTRLPVKSKCPQPPPAPPTVSQRQAQVRKPKAAYRSMMVWRQPQLKYPDHAEYFCWHGLSF